MMTGINYNAMCIHGVSLGEPCDQCKGVTEASIRGQVLMTMHEEFDHFYVNGDDGYLWLHYERGDLDESIMEIEAGTKLNDILDAATAYLTNQEATDQNQPVDGGRDG